MTFLYSHDAIVYSAYLNIIENLHLKESEKQTNEMFLNRDAVLDETIKLMDDRIADRKKKKLGEI